MPCSIVRQSSRAPMTRVWQRSFCPQHGFKVRSPNVRCAPLPDVPTRTRLTTGHSCQPASVPPPHHGGADRSHARSAWGNKSLPMQSSRSLADPNSRASRAQPCPVIGLRQRTGCDADLVTEPCGPCWTSGRSSPRFSKGIVSESAIYSPCCSRQPSRSLGHLLGSDGWLRTKEEDHLGRQAEALRRRSTRSWTSHG